MISNKSLPHDHEQIRKNIKNNRNIQIYDFKIIDEYDGKILFFAKTQKQEVVIKPTTQIKQADIMRQFIQNPYIVQIIDDFWQNDKHLLVLEKAQCDLDFYIRKFPVISQENLAEITRNILEGLSHMHTHNDQYWHRDLKPANIFIFTQQKIRLQTNKQKVFAKIGDLGSARQSVSDTQFTGGIGTDSFKSPQMQNSSIQYNSKIDVWSLGIILFQLYSKCSYTQYYSKPENIFNWRTQQGCKKIQEYLMKTLVQKYKGKFINVIKEIIKKCIHYNPQKRDSIKQILQYFISSTSSLIIKPQTIPTFSKFRQQSLKKLENYKKHHIFLQNQIKLANAKVNHFAKQILSQKELEPKQRKIIMAKQIYNNLLWEIKQYENVIIKYDEIIEAEIRLINHFNQSKPTDELIKLKIVQLEKIITQANNALNKIRNQAMKNLDVCFLIDGTGSMSFIINHVKQKIEIIVNDLKTNFNKIRFSYVIYRDFDQKEKSIQTSFFLQKKDMIKSSMSVQSRKSPYLKPLQLLDSFIVPKDKESDFNFSQFIDSEQQQFTQLNQQFLNGLKITGGDDCAQDINGGLQRTMQLDWKSYSKAIFHFTDAPCHRKQYNNLDSDANDYYLNKIPQSEIQYNKIFRQFKTCGIQYFMIQVKEHPSIKYMYNQFQKEFNEVKPFLCRVNTLGTINFMDNPTQKSDFSKLILEMGTKVNWITTSTIKSKRRIPKSKAEYEKQSAFDQQNEIKQFKN